MKRPTLLFTLPTLLTLITLIPSCISQLPSEKRGLAYHYPANRNDYTIFFTTNSTIKWYYNWSPSPSRLPSTQDQDVEFLPMIHGTSNLASDINAIKSLRTKPTHILTFNEPDGSTQSGGSNISPRAAAEAYIRNIVPLRSQGYQISHPVTTGSSNGLAWLQAFNTSCWTIDDESGCPTDFIAAHFYGDFPAMASWLGTLHAFYGSNPDLKIWLTEFALPQANANVTAQMLETSLPFLDRTEWVARYAWFGLFRTTEANEWTGDGVSLLDGQGRLTEAASLYLGGEERGYSVGDRVVSNSNDGGSGSGGGGGSGGDVSLGVKMSVFGGGMLGLGISIAATIILAV